MALVADGASPARSAPSPLQSLVHAVTRCACAAALLVAPAPGTALLLATTALTATLAPAAATAGTIDAALPRSEVLQLALGAYHRVERAGLLRAPLLTVIDYSLPSSERRLWVIDPAKLRVLFHEFVAHGRGSATEADPDRAVQFGNDPQSLRSSLGTFLTGDTYSGKHGHSLELIGLDPGVNDRAVERRIVMHPADYVSASYRAVKGGRVGRSWGCPALDPAVAPALIDRIQEGSVVYVAGTPAAPTLPLVHVASTGHPRGAVRVARTQSTRTPSARRGRATRRS